MLDYINNVHGYAVLQWKPPCYCDTTANSCFPGKMDSVLDLLKKRTFERQKFLWQSTRRKPKAQAHETGIEQNTESLNDCIFWMNSTTVQLYVNATICSIQEIMLHDNST